MLKRLIITTLMIWAYLSAESQIPKEPVNIQSPTAASIESYGDFPISYFTGTLNVQLPLYTLSDNKISIPLSLNYNASGFMPDAHPGWVGRGWDLMTGGLITRRVIDMPDDYNNPNLYTGANSGYYFNHDVLNTSNWNQTSYMKSIAEDDDMLKDTEPDEFTFSFPGGTGKFYMGANGEWKVQCDKHVKVTFNGQFLDVPFTAPYFSRPSNYGFFKSFSGFTITDEDGTQYVFGGDTSAIEYSVGIFTQNIDEWIADAWYLRKVISTSGQEFDLNYHRDNFIDQMYISIYNDLQTRTVSGGFLQPKCASWSYRSIAASYFGKLISPVYLASIVGSSCKAIFNRSTSTELRYAQSAYDWQHSQFVLYGNGYNDMFLPYLEESDYDSYPTCLNKLQWKKLDSINIVTNDNAAIKTFIFTYNNNSNERLTLLSVVEEGRNYEKLKPYQFSYDNSVALPGYLANKTDHWGFYNGTYADISNQSTYYTTYYNYREPNSTYLYAGVLNKVTYPTGRISEFTYEPNAYSKRLNEIRSDGLDASFNTNTLAGGLRIKKIKTYDPGIPTQSLERDFFYVNNYTNTANVGSLLSSGVLNARFKYYFDDYRAVAFNDNGVVYSKSIFSSQSVLPSCMNSHSPVGYSQVVEKRNDGSYTKYYFTNYDNGHIDEYAPSLQISTTAYSLYSSLEGERGKLIKQEDFNSNNILVRKKEIAYSALDKSTNYVKALKADYFNVCPGDATSVEEGTAYKHYIYPYLPIYETLTEYDENGQNPIVTTKSYNYDSYYKLGDESLKNNNSDKTFKTSYVYCYDYPVNTPHIPPINSYAVYRDMVNKNIIATPIETVNSVSQGGVTKITGGVLQLFSKDPNTNIISPSELLSLGITLPIGNFVPSDINVHTKVVNSVMYTYESLDYDSRYLSRITYDKYDNSGNVIQYHKSYSDVNNSYLWNYKNTYPVAKVSNAAAGYFAYTSFEAENKGNWTYSGTPSATGGAITGHKSYSLSSGSLSKSGLTSSSKYIVSYWLKSGGSVSISGGTQSNAVTGKTINGWTYHEVTISGASSISLSGSGYIDEVRLYPLGATVTTYTYDPLIGMTSQCDANNNITYYEYDNAGRLKLVRDEDGKILGQHDYQYQAANNQ